MGPMATGSEILLESLRHQKVEVVFGLPGGAVLPLYDALYSAGIRHLLVRHEQAAAFAADGYARAAGKPGVCLATSGPGATNLVTGLTSAMMDSTGGRGRPGCRFCRAGRTTVCARNDDAGGGECEW
jgi:acetolactate synthase I/II/III large subunit